MCTVGKVPNVARKIAVFGVYLPAKMRAKQALNAMEMLAEEISRVKTELNDPMVVIGGDYNKKPFNMSIANFPDITVIPTGLTRKDETLNLVMTNSKSVQAEVRDPLKSADGALKSDHSSIFVKARFRAEHRFEWKRIRSRPKTKKGDKKFLDWINAQNWDIVRNENDPNLMAKKLVKLLDLIITEAYPVKHRKIRSTDDPWITDAIRKIIKDRMDVFKKKKRSARWKVIKKESACMIKDSKKEYYQKFTKLAAETGDPSLYYKVVNRLKDRRAPDTFCVTSLIPGEQPEAAAEKVADFSCQIGDKFAPVTEEQLPDKEEDDTKLQVDTKEVEKRLKECKKPRGLLAGDIFPELLRDHADKLAPVVAHVLNAANRSETRPTVWKIETVHTIHPQKNHRRHLGNYGTSAARPSWGKLWNSSS